ncbi:MAG: hypothetical protein HY039_10450, partial [Nitrospirae bacterium]|nr:hypothetical protein [Nitrospirota bacterium]
MAGGRSTARFPARASAVFLAVAIGVLSALPASAHQVVFGPQKFVRAEGKPVAETVTFAVPAYASAPAFILRVQNGGSKATRVASAEIKLNGTEVVDEHEFKKNVAVIEKSVSLQPTNVLSVKIKSGHGGGGHEGEHHDSDVGADPRVRPFLIITIFAHWGDATPPTVSFTSPAEGARLSNSRPAIQASWSDDLSGIDPATAVLTIDGQAAAGGEATATGFRYVPISPLSDGAHVLGLAVRDFEGNEG